MQEWAVGEVVVRVFAVAKEKSKRVARRKKSFVEDLILY